MDKEQLWQKSIEFHGHQCGGLTIGYKAALYAIELLNLSFSPDEQVVCIAENNACGVDAIQVILGCSIGKGNLLFHMVGKQAFSFYNRKTGQSIRMMLKRRPRYMTRKESLEYYQGLEPKEMFDIMDTKIPLPRTAQLFDSYVCESCGETTGAHWIRIREDKKLCIDCYGEYNPLHL